jgi:hypothetical protein
MRNTPYLAAAASAALLALAGCNNQPETINTVDADPHGPANALPPEALPPSIVASKTYRCADNSLIYVDFYNNNTAMLFRGNRDATPVQLTATDGAPPFTGSGNSVSGNGDHVTINGKACHT